MSECGCEFEARNKQERKVLVILLLINAVMFVAEIIFGWIAESTALIADSLDMLADATVYGISLYAVGRAASVKQHAARLSGYGQILLGLVVLVDVLRRFVLGSEPEPFYMLAVGAVALIANASCLALIAKHRQGEVHMRASWIFSKNDVIANIGVIGAGVLVHYLHTSAPDLVIGLLIALVVTRGGLSILRETKSGCRSDV